MDEGKEFRQGNVAESDLFVGFGVGLAGVNIFGEEDLHVLAEKAWAGVVADESRPAACTETCFFDELAFGGGERRFAWLDAASGELQKELAGGVAVLSLDEDGRVVGVGGGIDSEDDDGAVVSNDVSLAGDAAGFGYDVGGDGEDAALEGDDGGENLCFLGGGFDLGFRGGFGGGGLIDLGRHGGTVSFCVGRAGGRIEQESERTRRGEAVDVRRKLIEDL